MWDASCFKTAILLVWIFGSVHFSIKWRNIFLALLITLCYSEYYISARKNWLIERLATLLAILTIFNFVYCTSLIDKFSFFLLLSLSLSVETRCLLDFSCFLFILCNKKYFVCTFDCNCCCFPAAIDAFVCYNILDLTVIISIWWIVYTPFFLNTTLSCGISLNLPHC